MLKIKKGDVCENGCGHAATGLWIGNGGTLAITRSHMQSKWCQCCMLKAQIVHAEERAADLESMRAELATVTCREAS